MMRVFFLVAVVGMFFVIGLSAQAAVTCPDGFYDSGAGVCIPSQTGLSQASVSYILETFMKWLLGIFGFIAVIAFVISGFQYLTAAGDESQAETAKRNLKYSLIGIVVAMSGLIILTAVTALLAGGNTTF